MRRLIRWKPNKPCGWIQFNEGAPHTRWGPRKFKLTGGLWYRICDAAGDLTFESGYCFFPAGFFPLWVGIYSEVEIRCQRPGPFMIVPCTLCLISRSLSLFRDLQSRSSQVSCPCASSDPGTIQSRKNLGRLFRPDPGGRPIDLSRPSCNARSISATGWRVPAARHEIDVHYSTNVTDMP